MSNASPTKVNRLNLNAKPRKGVCWVASHGDDDLPAGMSRLDVSQRCRGLVQRVGAVDHRPKPPVLDEPCQDRKVRVFRARDEPAQRVTDEGRQDERPDESDEYGLDVILDGLELALAAA